MRRGLFGDIASLYYNKLLPSDYISQLEDRHGDLPVDFCSKTYRSIHEDINTNIRYDWQASAHYLMYGREEGRRYQHRLIIALDGHDGSGKTTIAHLIADRLGGRVIKPFGGAFGQYMLWLSGQRKYDLLSRLAHNEMHAAIVAEDPTAPLVIDRHALTMHILLSSNWHSAWKPFGHSFLCYADSATVISRLQSRGEAVNYIKRHEISINRFRQFAEYRKIPIINTALQSANVSADVILDAVSVHF